MKPPHKKYPGCRRSARTLYTRNRKVRRQQEPIISRQTRQLLARPVQRQRPKISRRSGMDALGYFAKDNGRNGSGAGGLFEGQKISFSGGHEGRQGGGLAWAGSPAPRFWSFCRINPPQPH